MAKIHHYEIYTEDPTSQPPVLVALADLRKQRWPQEMGKKLRVLTRVITQQVEEIGEERRRLLTVHAKRGEDGEPIEVTSWGDLVDVGAFRTDFQEFLEETFEVEGLALDAVSHCDLLGETWSSPLLEETVAEKKAEGGAGAGESSADGQAPTEVAPAADN